MTRDEYERRKLRIEEQLRAGIELMESAYRAQMRALDPRAGALPKWTRTSAKRSRGCPRRSRAATCARRSVTSRIAAPCTGLCRT